MAFALAGFLVTAWQQRTAINLSETAGGQYPYLREAARMATEGVTSYLGDRNRNPLYLALLSTVHDESHAVYFIRATSFAVFTSGLWLVLLAFLLWGVLKQFGATGFMVTATAWLLYLPTASFVQAELLFYLLFLLAYLFSANALMNRSAWTAAMAGVLTGLAWLTKASGLIMLPIVLAGFLVVGLRDVSAKRSLRPRLVGGLVFLLAFGAVTAPLWCANWSHFGSPFYNVNSRFYMWFDSWSEARRFSIQCLPEQSFPVDCEQVLPGPVQYWKTHSVAQIFARLSSGFAAQMTHLVAHPMTKYVLAIWLLNVYLM
ncbi:MAG: hypothetical protein ACPGXK_13585, partial [Phycisphaerae bacterium]